MENRPQEEISRYISPDGVLTFLVVYEEGDVALGFEGTPWHTHADILAALSGLPEDEAVAQCVDALLKNKSVVGIATIDGWVRDIWVADNPMAEDLYKPENETITFRFWDGTSFDPLIPK
jgi:hypothetical protein